MKLSYTTLCIAVLIAGLISCKKGNNAVPIVGIWHETKLRLYEVDDNNKLLYDTTYLHPFTDLDYAHFNTDGTCNLAGDHYFYPNLPGYPKTPQATTFSVDTLTYASSRGVYILSQPNAPINYSGFYIADTAFVNGNTLLIRVFNHGISHSNTSGGSVIDSYFER